MTRSSTFDRSPAGSADPDPIDLDHLAASLDALMLSCRERDSDQTGGRPAHKAVGGEHQHFGETALVA